MRSENVIIDGEALRKFTDTSPMGRLISVTYRKRGKLHGKCEWFTREGMIRNRRYYKNGCIHGTSIKFNEEGAEVDIVRFKEGKRQGKCVWDKDNGLVFYYLYDKDITEEVLEFLEENPPIDGLYPAFVEGYFKLKYGLSLEELDIKVDNS